MAESKALSAGESLLYHKHSDHPQSFTRHGINLTNFLY